MGRAQVKFRATHGRGRGRGAGAPRGRGNARGGSSVGRSLGSNAFRYEEREQDEEDEVVELQPAATGRRQFFADEKSYRPATGAAKGTYFQSRAVQQWEADEGGDEDGGAAFGVLDFNWFAEQLATVSPSVRYRMDPKDCVDFAFEPVKDEDARVDAVDSLLAEDKQEPASTSKASALPAPVPSKTDEAALDSLLELSASASTTAGSRVANGLAASSITASAPAIAAAVTSQAQMEDWLDDVLDM